MNNILYCACVCFLFSPLSFSSRSYSGFLPVRREFLPATVRQAVLIVTAVL